MTPQELLQRIEELDQKATRGPWVTERRIVSHCINDGYGDGGYPNRSTFLIRGRHSDQIHSGESRFTRAGSAPDVAHDSDARLMALSRTALPALGKALKRAKIALDYIQQHNGDTAMQKVSSCALIEIESILAEVKG